MSPRNDRQRENLRTGLHLLYITLPNFTTVKFCLFAQFIVQRREMDIYAITSQEILERISRHCPEALSTYLQCINRVDNEGLVFFSRDTVEIDMSENWHPFKNNIKKLARENLLQWLPFNDGISVTLEPFNDQ